MKSNFINKAQILSGKFIKSKLAKGTIGSFVLKVTGTVLTLLSSILLARLLGPEQLGYYTFAISVITILTVPTVLGLPNLIVRLVASYETDSKWALMKGFFLRINQIVITISVITIAIALFLALYYSTKILSLDRNTLLIASILIPLLALNQLRASTLRGLGHITLSQIPETLIRYGLLILFLLIYYFFFGSKDPNAQLGMSLNVVATFIGFLVGLLFLFKKVPVVVKKSTPTFQTKEWIKPAIPLLIAGGMQIVNRNTDILMLGIIVGPEASGIYQVASKGAEFITFALIAVNMAVAPTLSKLYVKKNMEGLQRIVTISIRGILIYSVPMTLVFIFFGKWILSFVFGPAYASGALALSILSIGQLVNAGFGAMGMLLIMTGHERDSAKGVTISVILNILLNALFIPRWGIEGAAVATSISIITWNVLFAYWVYKKLKIKPLPI